MEPKVSDDGAESLGIHVRVTRGGCDALMAQEGLHVAQVGGPAHEGVWRPYAAGDGRKSLAPALARRRA